MNDARRTAGSVALAVRLESLRREYLARMPRQLDELARLIVAEHAERALHLAHRLRGTSDSYGLTALARLFAELEDLAERGDAALLRGAGLQSLMRARALLLQATSADAEAAEHDGPAAPERAASPPAAADRRA